MSKRRNLKKEKQERNRAYARKFKKRKLRTDGRPDGGNVTCTANNGGAADYGTSLNFIFLESNILCIFKAWTWM